MTNTSVEATTSEMSYLIHSMERDVQNEATQLKRQCEYLIRTLEETVARINKGEYEMINSCGVIQGNGTNIDLTVGRLRTLVDTHKLVVRTNAKIKTREVD